MRIQIIPTATHCESVDFKNKTVVIIDVLRASSVMTTALYNGAKAILPVVSIEQALEEYNNYNTGEALLCGERDAVRIEGFDLGNSPREYTRQRIQDKVIILTTSNGTVALNAAKYAEKLLVASFLNISSIADHLSHKTEELIIVCSGTAGEFSIDDGLCAGMLIALLSQNNEIQCDDLALVLKNFYEQNETDIISGLTNCKHLNYLIDNGFEKDVMFCLQVDIFKIIPHLAGNFIVAS
ncbi:MAG: 2-phosphosulfolactate phosphatase, partial [Bacteroidales bacterium]|nr:2-phosphosulfolactate phosphatase [Bacteroidales bacterium]